MWKEVTKGGAAQLPLLKNYENHLAEGQRGRIDFDLRWSLSDNIRGLLQSRLEAAGVEEVKVTASKTLRIEFRKALPWLAIIVAAVIALAILIISWRFYKEVIETIPGPVVVAGVIVGILLVAVVVLVIARRQLPVGGA